MPYHGMRAAALSCYSGPQYCSNVNSGSAVCCFSRALGKRPPPRHAFHGLRATAILQIPTRQAHRGVMDERPVRDVSVLPKGIIRTFKKLTSNVFKLAAAYGDYPRLPSRLIRIIRVYDRTGAGGGRDMAGFCIQCRASTRNGMLRDPYTAFAPYNGSDRVRRMRTGVASRRWTRHGSDGTDIWQMTISRTPAILPPMLPHRLIPKYQQAQTHSE
ncbi:uncharacterized protein MYCFIDRAFT_173166 [Pseudocercospora fijiensis CIRAD86]|uniref:Uncharacterized protein n=1 Tax=Pseudocercospora fijiensis (strain CIRAD86) TaxID=383855 RepID=M3B410_PSEFD|nr:uncharacterized protein MYCFIDRAFT_173166 [Pseudocercospora fijiensis CIRAD86]EME84118.1 hypothetical protein MYCFIDRAFT_173166 [Pseudocercospora fijiensis CIRAD86]